MLYSDVQNFDATVRAALYNEPPEWDEWDDSKIIQEARKLSKGSLPIAIQCGQLLNRLNLAEDDYKNNGIGICYRHGCRYIELATSPRMFRTDLSYPCKWTACYPLIAFDRRQGRYNKDIELSDIRYKVIDRIFEELIRRDERGFSLFNYNSTLKKVDEAIKACKRRLLYSNFEEESPAVHLLPHEFENRIVCGDCLHLIKMLRDGSINLVLTSPPYPGDAMEGLYQCVPTSRYVEWFCSFMTALHPKLACGGSVLVVIRAPQVEGRISPVVIYLRAALQHMGWFEPGELIRLTLDGPPTNANNRLRRCWEQILWFAKDEPYINLTANGTPTKKKGFHTRNPYGIYGTSTILESGIARHPDFFIACCGDTEDDIKHPAKFPLTLASPLIETFSPPGSTVLDPFSGSGTTAVCAKELGRKFTGFDIHQNFVNLANSRLSEPAKLFAVAGRK